MLERSSFVIKKITYVLNFFHFYSGIMELLKEEKRSRGGSWSISEDDWRYIPGETL